VKILTVVKEVVEVRGCDKRNYIIYPYKRGATGISWQLKMG
jgi:hypothetical protein